MALGSYTRRAYAIERRLMQPAAHCIKRSCRGPHPYCVLQQLTGIRLDYPHFESLRMCLGWTNCKEIVECFGECVGPNVIMKTTGCELQPIDSPSKKAHSTIRFCRCAYPPLRTYVYESDILHWIEPVSAILARCSNRYRGRRF